MQIRNAEAKDAKDILQLIRSLARYENAENEVLIGVEELLRDGFSEKALFRALVAETDKKLVAFALFYKRYSTWKGSSLYLEDLFVLDRYRGKGIGKALFYEVATIARQENCNRFEWQVLEWNKPAIEFYKSMNARFDSEWINCKFDSATELSNFLQSFEQSSSAFKPSSKFDLKG